MPLIIDLKPGEKVIVNGAVIESAGANTKLRIHNMCNILKQKEIMADTEANTPAARVYFCLQCAYIFPAERAKYLELFSEYLGQYVEACPSAAAIAAEIVEDTQKEQYYQALRAARNLLQHEEALLKHVRDAHADGQASPDQ